MMLFPPIASRMTFRSMLKPSSLRTSYRQLKTARFMLFTIRRSLSSLFFIRYLPIRMPNIRHCFSSRMVVLLVLAGSSCTAASRRLKYTSTMEAGRPIQSASEKAPPSFSLTGPGLASNPESPPAVPTISTHCCRNGSFDGTSIPAGNAFQCRVTKFFLSHLPAVAAAFVIAFAFGKGGPLPLPLPFAVPFPFAFAVASEFVAGSASHSGPKAASVAAVAVSAATSLVATWSGLTLGPSDGLVSSPLQIRLPD
mmetsp:Transcript_63203/g.151013  ORF Transcript_63203/g.151013 Transcript_63203/m.151013 type:complete len:253 (+) Transcript_63203:936-1694(+)